MKMEVVSFCLESIGKSKKKVLCFVVFFFLILIVQTRAFFRNSADANAKAALMTVYTAQESIFHSSGHFFESPNEISAVLPLLRNFDGMKLYFSKESVPTEVSISEEFVPFLKSQSFRILLLADSGKEGWVVNEKKEIGHFLK